MSKDIDIIRLLEDAMDAYRDGELSQADAIYDQILLIDANNYTALEWSGEIAIQQNNYIKAADRLSAAMAKNSDDFCDFANLGLAYYELDQPSLAVDNLWAAIKYNGDDLVAHSNLGKALYELHNIGEIKKSVKIAKQWFLKYPKIADARHMGAAVAGEVTPKKADEIFITEIFDDFSVDFDKKLADLDYRAPELIGQLVADIFANIEKFKTVNSLINILDAGCGTGLLSKYLRPYADYLTGVDLSEKMLKKALARGDYDKIIQAEITDFLNQHAANFYMVTAADVLCYFGDLKDIFNAVEISLNNNGYFAFSLELNKDKSSHGNNNGYNLQASGRYNHQSDYVKSCLATAGLKAITFNHDILRYEHGIAVDGMIIMVQKNTD